LDDAGSAYNKTMNKHRSTWKGGIVFMKKNGYGGLAILLIAAGALLLIGRLGWHPGNFIGYLMSWVIPLALVGLGYLALRRGSLLGWVIGGVGVIFLLGKLTSLIVIIAAIGLIVYGISLIGKGRKRKS
jgi:hypothetical protein